MTDEECNKANAELGNWKQKSQPYNWKMVMAMKMMRAMVMFLLEKKTRSSRAISSSPEEACWIGKGSCDGNSKGSDGFPNEKRKNKNLSQRKL